MLPSRLLGTLGTLLPCLALAAALLVPGAASAQSQDVSGRTFATVGTMKLKLRSFGGFKIRDWNDFLPSNFQGICPPADPECEFPVFVASTFGETGFYRALIAIPNRTTDYSPIDPNSIFLAPCPSDLVEPAGLFDPPVRALRVTCVRGYWTQKGSKVTVSLTDERFTQILEFPVPPGEDPVMLDEDQGEQDLAAIYDRMATTVLLADNLGVEYRSELLRAQKWVAKVSKDGETIRLKFGGKVISEVTGGVDIFDVPFFRGAKGSLKYKGGPP